MRRRVVRIVMSAVSVLCLASAVFAVSGPTASADALCDALRDKYGPGWPCVSVPTNTFTPPANSPSPVPGDSGNAATSGGPRVGSGIGPGPGEGNGTPIVPVPTQNTPNADIPAPGNGVIVPVPGAESGGAVPRTPLPSGESPQAGVSLWPPAAGWHQAGCDLWDQSNCESARNFDTFKVCEAAGGYLSGGQLIAKFERGIYMSCGDWRHIRDAHFQTDGVSDQNRWDFLNCVSNAIVYGEDWDEAKPPNVGYKYKNPHSGVWVYVSVRPGVGDVTRTIATAFTSGDSKDWGGSNAGGPSLY